MPIGIGAALPAVGALAGLFGGGDDQGPQLSPQQQRLFKLLLARFRHMNKYANSNTMSTEQERQGVAQAQGLSSEAAGRNREGLFGQMGPADLANSPTIARTLANLSAAETAQSSSIYGNAAQQGLAERHQLAFQGIPQMLMGMGSIAGNPSQPGYSGGGGFDSLLPLLGQIGSQWGQSGGGGNAQPGGTTYGGGGARDWSNYDPYNRGRGAG